MKWESYGILPVESKISSQNRSVCTCERPCPLILSITEVQKCDTRPLHVRDRARRPNHHTALHMHRNIRRSSNICTECNVEHLATSEPVTVHRLYHQPHESDFDCYLLYRRIVEEH